MAATGREERNTLVRQRVLSEERERENARECSSEQCLERAWEFVHSPLVRAFLSSPQRLTFVPSSVCQPIAPPTLVQHIRVSRGLKLMRPGRKPQRGRCHCASPQNKHDLCLSYALRLRHRRGIRRSAPVWHSCHSVSGDNSRSTWTAVFRVLWPNTEQPRSSTQQYWAAVHRSARPRSGSGVLLPFLFIRTSTHHSFNQQHRLVDDQPAAARHDCLSTGNCRRSAAGLKSRVRTYSSTYRYTRVRVVCYISVVLVVHGCEFSVCRFFVHTLLP
jgi:hypothetical protein